MEKLQLKRTKQCAKCPWKVTTDPYDIPHGYSEERHKNLERTIAKDLRFGGSLNVMSCHESPTGDEAHCIGWLADQLGPGNNIGLRLAMMRYDLSKVELDGEQHETFEDTLP